MFSTYLFSILPSRRVQALYKIGGMAQEHGVAGGPADHAQHCQPHVSQGLRGEAAIANTKHVGHGLEQGPGILLQPVRLLENNNCS